jgi:NADPH:quinone reductase-like Zn-dependent oxidoreductase
MRAWELRDFGWENLVLTERPVPEPGPGQVLVRVGGAALNSRDLQILHDQYYPDQRFPIVLGSDGAGDVVAVGEGVERPAVGDRVAGAFAQGWISGERTWERWLTHLGGQLDGVFADYVVFEADAAIPVPPYLSDAEAAAATSAAATAWRALIEVGHVRPGDTVLVQGTGGVALFALQFAQLAGARVIVTSSSDEKLARTRGLGAWAGVNYRTHPEWHEEVLRLTDGVGVDHVVETAGDLARAVGCLRMGGLISMLGYVGQLRLAPGEVADWTLMTPIIPLLIRQARLQALSCAPAQSFAELFRAMEAVQLRPVVDRTFPFEELPAALRHLQAGRHVGKVGLEVASTG